MADGNRWSRRDVVRLGGAGLAAAAAGDAWAGVAGLPGAFPGKVVAVEHGKAYTAGAYQAEPVQQMIRRGLVELTGAPDYVAAWRTLVEPGEVVGIKANTNGNPYLVSSRAFFMEIVDGLMRAGIRRQDIVLYDRYQSTMKRIQAWFPDWLRLDWAAPDYDDVQQDIRGYDSGAYVDFAGVRTADDPRSEKARRSYAALFVTRKVNKVINCPVPKTHGTAGVTLALKNLSHGLFNNVCRSHPSGTVNYCRDFIPAMVALPAVRGKVVLNVMDGIHGLYHGGPYGNAKYVWQHNTMYFATDAVALDRVGWKMIDAKRAAMGMPAVAESPADSEFRGRSRQPDHILVAGRMGLGECRDEAIKLGRFVLG